MPTIDEMAQKARERMGQFVGMPQKQLWRKLVKLIREIEGV